MIDKSQYYHGAAIMSLLQDKNLSLTRKGLLGYVVNNKVFAFFKYRTNPRTPWIFIFDQEDVERCSAMNLEYEGVIVGLICGGDGVCWITWKEASELLDLKPGRITLRRKHGESYGVFGQVMNLKRKIPVSRWATIISDLKI
ncbi:hypothetical protein K2Y00_01015 [Patescibacteria group bacterium]|nr:hypothetical protein [Patescibacteria group bacterium]